MLGQGWPVCECAEQAGQEGAPAVAGVAPPEAVQVHAPLLGILLDLLMPALGCVRHEHGLAKSRPGADPAHPRTGHPGLLRLDPRRDGLALFRTTHEAVGENRSLVGKVRRRCLVDVLMTGRVESERGAKPSNIQAVRLTGVRADRGVGQSILHGAQVDLHGRGPGADLQRAVAGHLRDRAEVDQWLQRQRIVPVDEPGSASQWLRARHLGHSRLLADQPNDTVVTHPVHGPTQGVHCVQDRYHRVVMGRTQSLSLLFVEATAMAEVVSEVGQRMLDAGVLGAGSVYPGPHL